MSNPSILSFSPNLAELEALQSHRSTLESFGKKVDEKVKSLRGAEILFAAKKAEWDQMADLAREILANSEQVLILTEGLSEALFRAIESLCLPFGSRQSTAVRVISSNLHGESLKHLAHSLVGRKVSLLLVYHSAPSERLFWCFHALVQSLSQGRHPDEVARRVIVTTGEAATEWERWAQKSPYRNVSFPPRCAGRYLFFTPPTAFFMSLLGLNPWSYVEGGRSFLRQYDKVAEIEDPILAYAALREVQLAEHHRETLVIPDESYSSLGHWWQLISEDSRRAISEEVNDSLVWTGNVMKEGASTARQHWVTELALEVDSSLELPALSEELAAPSSITRFQGWRDLESVYRHKIDSQRSSQHYAQPPIRITLRRRDSFCLGGLFAFFEAAMSASHKLAETAEAFSLCTPHTLSASGASV